MKYRKKPVVIEAIQFAYTDEGIAELKAFCGPKLGLYGKERYLGAVGWAEIKTLEDGTKDSVQVTHVASEGDYIIRGVLGEFYPCKADIFNMTYEADTTPLSAR